MGLIPSSKHLCKEPKEIPEPFVLSHWIISEPPGSEKRVRRRPFLCQNWVSEVLAMKTKQPRHTLTLPSFWRTALQGFVLDTTNSTYSELYSIFFLKLVSYSNVFYFTWISSKIMSVCVPVFVKTVCNFPQILMGVCDENKLKNHPEIIL